MNEATPRVLSFSISHYRKTPTMHLPSPGRYRGTLGLFFLLTTTLFAAEEIRISGPSKPIKPGRLVRLLISGISDKELAGSDATVTTPKGVDLEDIDLFPGRSWTGSAYIDFASQQPGRYLIEVGVNRWSDNLKTAVDAATQAKIEADLLKELQVSVTKIQGKYPSKAGSIVVEVEGTPNPPPEPPVPPVTEGKRRIIIIKESMDETSAISDLYVSLQKKNGETQKYLELKGHKLDILDPMNCPQQWLDAVVKSGKELPAMVIADASNSSIVGVVDFPKSAPEFLTTLKANGG